MKQLLILSSLLAILIGCKENGKTSNDDSSNEALQIQIETKQSKSNSEATSSLNNNEKRDTFEFKNKPCKELISFVIEIENLNWVSDTLRLNEVKIYPQLDRQSMKIFERPFYQITFNKSNINEAYNWLKNDDMRIGNFDIEIYKSVKSIWGYFYRDKEKTSWNPDGVIEQWEFKNEVEAKIALNQLEEYGERFYPNIKPYFSRVRNYLIIFHSRASVFSMKQREIFEKFKEEKST